jgi:RNA polymerase sigma-70 factor (ECF subfamily)
VQEIRLQLWRAYPSYDPGRTFSTWMYRVALNTAISFARDARARRQRAVPLDHTDLAEPAKPEADDRLAELYRVLHGMEELDRALLVLYLEDRSYREIGEILGISETNVGTKLNRLKQRVRQGLAPEKGARDGAR